MTKLEDLQEKCTHQLPPGWRAEKLSTLLIALESGSRPPGGAVGVFSGIPSISAEHMTDQGTFDFSIIRYVPQDHYRGMQRGHIHRGDILIVKDGATTGKTCFVDEDFPFDEAVVNEHVFICRPDTAKVVPRFLFYWLWSSPGFHAIRSSFQGAAIGGINQKFTEAVEVPVPPLEQQRRIAAILEKQMTTVERARQAAGERWHTASALPSAILRFIFGTPQKTRWPQKPLSDVASLLSSRSIASAGDATVLAVTTACLSEAGFLPEGVKKARMQSEHVDECLVRAGEVLVARSNTPELVGRVSMYSGAPPGVVASDLTIRIWADDRRIRAPFLARYLSFLYQSGFWQEKAGGASGSMKKITRTQLLRLEVPVPDLDKQDAIVKRIDEQLRLVRRLLESAREEMDTINNLPEALMRIAFNGVR
jgi:type I restriction enzyme S subunit